MTTEVLVTGGAGYVGSSLVPRLLEIGHRVRVLDWFLYGENVLDSVKGHPNLRVFRADIRNAKAVEAAVKGCEMVIHLACISNDPSFELHPSLGRSINLDAFEPLVKSARRAGVRRFVYASSSSVYGVKQEDEVTEDLLLEPLTDYSKLKAQCEEILLRYRASGFETLVVRPATVCGYSPRLRLDLTVNILTSHAVHTGVIKVFGGQQLRPNIHIEDMVDLYSRSLEWPTDAVDGKVFNVGYQNQSVRDIAETVRRIVRGDVGIVTVPTDDNRSYRISSDKIRLELGFAAQRTVEDAVCDLVDAFRAGRVPDAMTDERYYNLKVMKRWLAEGHECSMAS